MHLDSYILVQLSLTASVSADCGNRAKYAPGRRRYSPHFGENRTRELCADDNSSPTPLPRQTANATSSAATATTVRRSSPSASSLPLRGSWLETPFPDRLPPPRDRYRCRLTHSPGCRGAGGRPLEGKARRPLSKCRRAANDNEIHPRRVLSGGGLSVARARGCAHSATLMDIWIRKV